MSEATTTRTPASGSQSGREPSLLERKIVTPLMDLLRTGISPRKLAWSLALGVAVGINPLLGSTTVLCLALAWLLRLNLIASQISNHLVYPLQLALFFVFLRVGDHVFHTGPLPMDHKTLLEAVRHHPWETTKLLWNWEWHALIVWAAFAAIMVPVLAIILRPLLHRALVSLHHHDHKTPAAA